MTLEKLLNILCENGWKPRGLERIKGGIIYCGPRGGITFQHKGRVFDFGRADYVLYNGKEYLDYDSYITHFADSVIVDTKHIFEYRKSLRTLCSKESGLWQFCIENGMVEVKHRDRRCYDEDRHLNNACFDDDYEYRLIESALKDESELEDFLLNSIIIDD